MTPHERVLAVIRRTKIILFVVAGLYVGFGLMYGWRSVVSEPASSDTIIDAFVGLLIVSGALAGAAVLVSALRLAVRVSAMHDLLQTLEARLLRVEIDPLSRRAANEVPTATQELDLSAIGDGDARSIVAASLDQDLYPRLARRSEGTRLVADEDTKPFVSTQGRGIESDRAGTDARDASEHGAFHDQNARVESTAHSLGSKHLSDDDVVGSLLERWEVASGEGDVATCRRVLASLANRADRELVVGLRDELPRIMERAESALREAFAECVRSRDFAGAVTVGDRITESLPESRIARDYDAIKPHLLRHLG